MPLDHEFGVRVLVAGLPRSGTTWMARMLASCEDTALVLEPDNPNKIPFALHKRKVPGGYYSALAPSDEAPLVERLWQEVFQQPPRIDKALDVLRRRAAGKLLQGDRRDVRAAFTSRPHLSMPLRLAETLALPARPPGARNIIVKSVYAARALEWISDRVDARIVIVQRDLRSVVSSWMELWGIGTGEEDELEVSDPIGLERVTSRLGIPPPPVEPLERTTWLLAVLDRLMADTAARHPDWTVVRYEDLCDDPAVAFRSLARHLGLTWGAGSDELVRASNRPGTRYETYRVAAEARDVWRVRLTPEQERQVSAVVAAVGSAR